MVSKIKDPGASIDTPWLVFDNLPIWDEVLYLGRRVVWPRGARIRGPGDPAHGIFLIRSGLIKVSAVSREGMLRTLWLMGAGSVLGEAALLSGKPYRHEISVMEPAEAHEFPEPVVMRELLEKYPALSRQLLVNIAAKSYIGSSQLEDAVFLNGPQRVARLLYGLDQVHRSSSLPVSHLAIAEMLGLHRVTVSNAIGLLRRAGFLDETTHGIRVADPDGLAAYAQDPSGGH
ncbi:Crp/Fnr family transcriptional regulator [Castellaniella defragrans]|uniref:CRP-like cAMP-binding protein n=1 Tax=Castellaniella defragrans TaxID=75697 RepID=A0A7W9TME9_CASDE|nr:Crp/Fnr family transcriptional regulator [Castellaniella defragrans]MBB6082876.1 CRP-like cAMP-binding protein [Castellaniella defragrans]